MEIKNKQRITILLFVIASLITFFSFPIGILYIAKEPKVNYHVPKDFLRDDEGYANTDRQLKQFVRYSPFPFSITKPKHFKEGTIIAFKYPYDLWNVRIGRIQEMTSQQEYIVTIPNSDKTVTINYNWIIARD